MKVQHTAVVQSPVWTTETVQVATPVVTLEQKDVTFSERHN